MVAALETVAQGEAAGLAGTAPRQGATTAEQVAVELVVMVGVAPGQDAVREKVAALVEAAEQVAVGEAAASLVEAAAQGMAAASTEAAAQGAIIILRLGSVWLNTGV